MEQGSAEVNNGAGEEPSLAPALLAQDVRMRFGRIDALKGVSLRIERGTIHALVGENGAGKSTFLGAIAGRVKATHGRISVYGAEIPLGNPRAALSSGVAAIYQELAVIPALTGVANVFVGAELSKRWFLSEREMRKRYEELCKLLGVKIPANVPMRYLTVAAQQSVEIMRGLNADARLLLLDEPTSALGRAERDVLFKILRDLRTRDVTSVFVSHDLDDVLELAETISVFRDGRLVASDPREEWTKRRLVSEMLGRATVAPAPRGESTSETSAAFEIRDLTVRGAVHAVSLSIAPGEIVGLAGLAGSGRSSLLRALAGAEGRRSDGLIRFQSGEWIKVPQTTGAAARAGIGLIPEDRKRQGLVLGMTALENICLPAFAGAGVFSRRRESVSGADAAKAVGFDPARLHTPARNLSGGNQQKLLLARWARRNLRLLLADEPTRGVDVGAKAEILNTIRNLAAKGLAVIVASSEFEELEAIADRVVVLVAGRCEAVLRRDAGEIDVPTILHAAFGADDAGAATYA